MHTSNLPPFFDGCPLPPLEDILAGVRVVEIPMRVKFRGVTSRQAALIHGPAGWAEFAAFVEYGAEEASAWLASAIEAAWLGYPEPLRAEVPVNATMPAVAAHEVPEVLANYEGEIHEIKIKVAESGQGIDDDIARVAAVRAALPQARLKVDANMGWSHDQAVDALVRMAEYDLVYAEQPVSTVEGLARVREELRRRGVGTLIAADESVRKAADPLRVAQLGAADVLVVKAAPLGGVRRAREVVRAAGLPAVVSSALETSVGIRAGVALAASLDELPFGCGLDTVSLMAADTAAPSLRSRDGVIRVRDVAADEDLLLTWAASPQVTEWWHRRIKECYRVLSDA